MQRIVSQVLGDFQAYEENMNVYLQKTEELLGYFKELKPKQIPREMNEDVDTIAILASATNSELRRLILVELLNKPSTHILEQVLAIQLGESWMMSIVTYLKGDGLSKNQLDARRIKANAVRYLIKGISYTNRGT